MQTFLSYDKDTWLTLNDIYIKLAQYTMYIFNTIAFTGMKFRNSDFYLINLQMLIEKKSKIRKLLEIIT